MNKVWETLERETGWVGTDVNSTNRTHSTALRMALQHTACHNLVPALLEMGSDPNHTHPELLPMLHIAVLYAPHHLNALLAHGANPFICDRSGGNLFDCVVSSSPQATALLLQNNIGVFEIRKRYYDPHWETKISASVHEVIGSHISAQRSQGKSGMGQFNATQTTSSKSSSLG